MTINFSSIAAWVVDNARPIDKALLDFHLGSGSAEAIVRELSAYQNDDGGFGQGLEADLGMPQSSALATSVALQYLALACEDRDEPALQRALAYLGRMYDPDRKGWPIITAESDQYPHAPWWDYQQAMATFGWGNPSAELLGYLLKWEIGETWEARISDITDRALERLTELTTANAVDFHELSCFAVLFQSAGESLKRQMHDPLVGLIAAAINPKPEEWGGYGATPLTFVRRPDSPFADLFDKQGLDANLDFIEKSIVGDHWEPVWDWGGVYADEWTRARAAWSGKLTVDNLILLDAFGRTEPVR